MSSEDTLSAARSEKQSADDIQKQIDRIDMNVKDMQKDIDNQNAVKRGLEQKKNDHIKSFERLEEEGKNEKRQEEQERQRQEQQKRKSLAQKGVEGYIKHNFFG